jgi:hypothetical protein
LVRFEKSYVVLDAGLGKVLQPRIILMKPRGCTFGRMNVEVPVKILVY